MRPLLPDRLVVVSPHLDDGVLSLGSSIAFAARAGHQVTIITVFAGDTESDAPAGGWDRRAGFSTAGEAAKERRLEDARACAVVGASPVWLSFSEPDYTPVRDEDEVWSAVDAVVDPADVVLIPGFPLTNPDHLWLSTLLWKRRIGCRRLGLYAEQPYRSWARGRVRRPAVPVTLEPERASVTKWSRLAGSVACMRAKRTAIAAYRSQISLLGLDRKRISRLDRLLIHEALSGGETIAWSQPSAPDGERS